MTTIVWGLAGTGAALAMTRVRSALDAWWTLAGIFGGGTLGLFLLGFVSRRAASRGALAGVAAGVLLTLWMTLSPSWPAFPAALRSPFHEFLIIVFGTAVVLAVGLAFGRRGTAVPQGTSVMNLHPPHVGLAWRGLGLPWSRPP